MLFDLSAAPHFTDKPQDVQKTIDDTLVWDCKASAKPKPSYRWLKNGELLDPMEVNKAFEPSGITCACGVAMYGTRDVHSWFAPSGTINTLSESEGRCFEPV